MMPLRDFSEFLKEGIVKKQRQDVRRAESLIAEAGMRKVFLDDMLHKIGLSDENANYFVECAYDILMELIRAKLFLNGFKASGISAHEAEVSYLRRLGFSEPDVRFANELRYFRNGINYRGERLDAEYAGKVLEFLSRLYPGLKQ